MAWVAVAPGREGQWVQLEKENHVHDQRVWTRVAERR